MRLTITQIRELKKTGKVKLDMGVLKRIKRNITGYHDTGKGVWVFKKMESYGYKVILDKKFVNYLNVIDEN